jgi:hypothetical protein
VETSLQNCAAERQEPEKKIARRHSINDVKIFGYENDQWEDTKVLEEGEKYTGAYNIH